MQIGSVKLSISAALRPASRADQTAKGQSVTTKYFIAKGIKSKTCSAVSKIGDASTPAMTDAPTPSCPPFASPQPLYLGSDQCVLTLVTERSAFSPPRDMLWYTPAGLLSERSLVALHDLFDDFVLVYSQPCCEVRNRFPYFFRRPRVDFDVKIAVSNSVTTNGGLTSCGLTSLPILRRSPPA